MSVVSMKSLLEAGVHFGHQTRRWNPKMSKFIFTERNGIYIIDLQKTVKKVEELILDLFFDGELQISSDMVLSNLRHINALREAKKDLLEVNESLNKKVFLDLIEVDLENVIAHISEITGAITTEDILDRVFSDFCIGK